MSTVTQSAWPVFNTPARWALRLLSWLAFGIAAYLAWGSITQTPVAGCSVGSSSGCDAVLNSPWSKWLGLPVAVAGLACYATLAGLSVLLGVQDARTSRWINTAFVLLATIAAGASLWFIGVQVFAIGAFCPYCIATDVCGIAIGAIAIWFAWRAKSAMPQLARVANSSAGLATLRSALPAGSRPAPVPGVLTPAPAVRTPSPNLRRDAAPPSLAIAFGGAAVLLLVLVGGQIAFRAKTFEVQQVALQESINLSGSDEGDASSEDAAQSDEASTRVAMRIPAEEGDSVEPPADTTSEPQSNGSETGETTASPPSDSSQGGDASAEPANQSTSTNGKTESIPATTASTAPKRERKVKLLKGKLTLDVYKHPLIGSTDAPHIVAELISYDCPHCRKTHRLMKQALSRYGDQVALIVLVVPLEKGCNRLITTSAGSHAGACTTARMALGVAKIKPASFGRFHDYLMSGSKDKPPSLDSIIAKAYNTADRTRLRELRTSNELDKEIAATVDLYDMIRKQNSGNKEFGLPIQIIGDHIMSGSVEKADDIYKAWEQHLGVKPR